MTTKKRVKNFHSPINREILKRPAYSICDETTLQSFKIQCTQTRVIDPYSTVLCVTEHSFSDRKITSSLGAFPGKVVFPDLTLALSSHR